MKNLILYLTISMTLVCCTSKQERSVLLFNKILFKLNDGEEVVKIDSNKKEIFNSYFDKKSVQMPLFRCIKSDSHLIFIAIPFNTSLKELSEHSLTHTLNQTFFEGDSAKYFYKNYSNEKEQITIYTRNFSNNLVYVLAASNSAESFDSLFSKNELLNRFKK
ncbi:MAG: hypothetical protein ABF250_05565 [Polaribacter sp.]|uniref:hypothetical protein n=1 Tax=Polaribacter sp. TaxID=1920175 RepID=UPI003219012C